MSTWFNLASASRIFIVDPCKSHATYPPIYGILEATVDQWEFQDPKMKVLYHIRPYFVGIFPYIGLKNRPCIGTSIYVPEISSKSHWEGARLHPTSFTTNFWAAWPPTSSCRNSRPRKSVLAGDTRSWYHRGKPLSSNLWNSCIMSG